MAILNPFEVQLSPPGRGLRSDKSAKFLELISRLRARGIGNHVALPQLVVCGDQSAGKSSVLEGLTGIPFPRQEGLCTTFATEIILQHHIGDTTVKASIIASDSRSPEDKLRLTQYEDQQPLDKLPDIIQDAGDLMGVRKPGSNTIGPAFVDDVLRIEVRGPHGIHLSVVDLPGLISVPSEEQTDEDVATVHQLVDKYVSDQRTIILAVVQASNDIANQAIIQKSRKYDPAGERTVGIITKPDLINKGSENRIALLASNKDTTKLKLGFFLVKNPSPLEMQNGMTTETRFKNETKYFQSSPWAEQALNSDRTGTPALRSFLQDLLERHIKRELPRVRDEVKAYMQKTETELASMGDQRSEHAQMRIFLTRTATSFHGLLTSATNGTYDDSGATFFAGSDHHSRRLRAVVQKMNSKYSDDMMERGQKRKIVHGLEREPQDTNSSSSDKSFAVTEKEMKQWIHSIYESARGKELAGTYNYVLLAELFREQSSPWFSITEDHVQHIDDAIRDVVNVMLTHVVADEQVLLVLKQLVEQQLDKNMKAAREELSRIWDDEQQQPITYNHYFTDNIQKARQASTEELLRHAMNATKQEDWNGKIHISNVQVDIDRLVNGLQRRINVNMNEQAYAEALNGLSAYYKVARKLFVDNVCRQVIERHLLRKLPILFSPELVAAMDDHELERIAAETPKLTEERKQLQALQKDLEVSLKELTAVSRM